MGIVYDPTAKWSLKLGTFFFFLFSFFFFKCPFSKRIWQAIKQLSLVPGISYNWEEVVNLGIHYLQGSNFKASLCKVAWWATVYHIWIQRNNIIHFFFTTYKLHWKKNSTKRAIALRMYTEVGKVTKTELRRKKVHLSSKLDNKEKDKTPEE